MLFHRYFELKKNQVSKLAQQEQVQVQIRTMQNTILPPLEPLGAENVVAELQTEMAPSRTTNIPPVNSGVAGGSTLTLIPVSTSKNNHNNNERSLRCYVTNAASTNTGSGAAGSFGDILSLLEMMNNNTKAMLLRPIAEVQRDYKAAMASLQRAKDDNDDSRVMFSEIAVCNLFKEIQSMDE